MSIQNFYEIIKRPEWAFKTLINGQPEFETLKPYMPKGLNLSQLAKFMDETFDGRLNEEKIKDLNYASSIIYGADPRFSSKFGANYTSSMIMYDVIAFLNELEKKYAKPKEPKIKKINISQGDMEKTVAGLSKDEKDLIKDLLRRSGVLVGD